LSIPNLERGNETERQLNNSTFGIHKPAVSADGPRHPQFHLSAPKARCGRPGNSLSLKQSGPLILRRA